MGALPTKVITLSDGIEVIVDVSTMTRREWRGLWDIRVPDEDSDKVLSRLCNVKTEYIGNLLNDDYRRILETITQLANRPLDDPNSRSGSTLP